MELRLARMERQYAQQMKVLHRTLSLLVGKQQRELQPKRHGKMARDKCRVSDVVYRLAVGSPRLNHSTYTQEMAFNFIKGLTLAKEKKAMSKACDYACRIPEDQTIKVYKLNKGKVTLVTQVQGRRSKVKGAVPNIGYSRIIWLSPDVEGNFDHLKPAVPVEIKEAA